MNQVKSYINHDWDNTVIPTLEEYIKVPNQSSHFDSEWDTNGLLDKAMDIILKWVKKQPIKGLKVDLLRSKGEQPLLIAEIGATTPKTKHTVLMYGHMDKQPPLLPWDEGLGPYTPVIRDGKLYGRGGADDGYSAFAAFSSIAALQKAGIPHGHIFVVIEADEESGSANLMPNILRLKSRLGDINLIICLDSGSYNYDQLWLTSSLRGAGAGVLKVKILKEGIHSGVAGGVVPDSFRIARHLLDRVENAQTGEVLLKSTECKIPDSVLHGMEEMNKLGDSYRKSFCTVPGMSLVPGDNLQLAVKNFWRPSITVTGDNLPQCEDAGNVIRCETLMKISLRTPPTVNVDKAMAELSEILIKDPPYGAEVTFTVHSGGAGWAAPEMKPWLRDAANEASTIAYGKPFAVAGLGGTIPFMGELADVFPKAQFIVTGVLGPMSNAHGPNEFLHIDFAKKVTISISHIIAAHAKFEP